MKIDFCKQDSNGNILYHCNEHGFLSSNNFFQSSIFYRLHKCKICVKKSNAKNKNKYKQDIEYRILRRYRKSRMIQKKKALDYCDDNEIKMDKKDIKYLMNKFNNQSMTTLLLGDDFNENNKNLSVVHFDPTIKFNPSNNAILLNKSDARIHETAKSIHQIYTSGFVNAVKKELGLPEEEKPTTEICLHDEKGFRNFKKLIKFSENFSNIPLSWELKLKEINF